MLIIDLNYIVISSTAWATKELGAPNVTENVVRHMVLAEILQYKTKFSEYGEVVIALDSASNWRYEVFPYYKSKRQTAQLDFDIKFAKECAKKIGQELIDNFPYKTIKVPRAEADDVIATLVKYARGADGQLRYKRGTSEVMIVSPDKDFKPLQSIPGVRQWSPRLRAEMREPDPLGFLAELIIKGDTGDGVPNIYSPDDHFTLGVRAKAVRARVLEELTECFKKKQPFPEELRENFERNKRLVDLLECVPDDIANATIELYTNYKPAPRMKMLNYFSQHQLIRLSGQIQNF